MICPETTGEVGKSSIGLHFAGYTLYFSETTVTLQTYYTICKAAMYSGAIISAIGGFGAYIFYNKIKNSPPDLLIESITPVMLYKPIKFNSARMNEYKFMDKGISFVIHLKSKSRPITVSRLEVKGKIYTSLTEYLGLLVKAGTNVNEAYQEWKDKKPYVNVELTAYIDEKRSNGKLDAFEDKVISFILLDSIGFGQAETGWFDSFSDYVGYSDGSKKPIKLRTYPEYNFIFKTVMGNEFPFDIRDEIKNGELEFTLVAGARYIPISYEVFKKIKTFELDYWENNALDKIIFRDK